MANSWAKAPLTGSALVRSLASVSLPTKPVTVLFDDYLKRRYYHGVERLARKEEMVGRMARFTVTPDAIPAEMVTQAIGWFTDPR